jgi:hypothetical protein
MNPTRILTSMGKRFRGEKGAALGITGALVLSYPLLIAAALWPNALLFAVFALAGYVTEAMAAERAGQFSAALNQVGLSATMRAVFRETALLLLLAREETPSTGWFVATAATVVLLHVLRAVHSNAALRVITARAFPVLTRGFDLSRLRVPGPPPVFVRRHRDLLNLDVIVLAGGPASVAAGAAWPMAAALVLTAVAWLTALAVTARQVRLNRHLADRDRVLKLVAEEVAAYGPEVVLYFSGAEDCMYQINMWLETFDRLEKRKMIILRERANLPLLGRTSTPVLCFPGGTEMMNFPMPATTRVALFPANAGTNIHMLRIPEVHSVFVGHGDSDKAASFNPFSKVYDQVWVAGPAGRERYMRSEAGVRDEDIVEVGRPQLAPIDTTGATPDPILTVLYAPTWEGWTGDKYHTSVAVMGPALVRLLLDHAPHVRLLYKPHPMAGKDSAAVRRAHQKIVNMIAEANAARDARGEWSTDPARTAAARTRLQELTATLSGLGGGGDAELEEAEASRAAAVPDVAGDARHRETLAEAERTYWEAEGWWRHRVVTGSVPHLYGCFNRADLLITDVSSVVADFIASGKPYVVTNGANLPDEEFVRQNPSTSAAYLLGRDCSGLAAILAAVSADGEDVMAPRRRELKRYLLGADEPDAMSRFTQAVDDLMKERVRSGATA